MEGGNKENVATLGGGQHHRVFEELPVRGDCVASNRAMTVVWVECDGHSNGEKRPDSRDIFEIELRKLVEWG